MNVHFVLTAAAALALIAACEACKSDPESIPLKARFLPTSTGCTFLRDDALQDCTDGASLELEGDFGVNATLRFQTDSVVDTPYDLEMPPPVCHERFIIPRQCRRLTCHLHISSFTPGVLYNSIISSRHLVNDEYITREDRLTVTIKAGSQTKINAIIGCPLRDGYPVCSHLGRIMFLGHFTSDTNYTIRFGSLADGKQGQGVTLSDFDTIKEAAPLCANIRTSMSPNEVQSVECQIVVPAPAIGVLYSAQLYGGQELVGQVVVQAERVLTSPTIDLVLGCKGTSNSKLPHHSICDKGIVVTVVGSAFDIGKPHRISFDVPIAYEGSQSYARCEGELKSLEHASGFQLFYCNLVHNPASRHSSTLPQILRVHDTLTGNVVATSEILIGDKTPVFRAKCGTGVLGGYGIGTNCYSGESITLYVDHITSDFVNYTFTLMDDPLPAVLPPPLHCEGLSANPNVRPLKFLSCQLRASESHRWRLNVESGGVQVEGEFIFQLISTPATGLTGSPLGVKAQHGSCVDPRTSSSVDTFILYNCKVGDTIEVWGLPLPLGRLSFFPPDRNSRLKCPALDSCETPVTVDEATGYQSRLCEIRLIRNKLTEPCRYSIYAMSAVYHGDFWLVPHAV